MIGVALKGLLGRKLRATLTAFAIVLGVAMISGSFILTDTLSKSFDGIYEESYKSTDAIVTSKVAIRTEDGDTEAPPFSAGVLARSPTAGRPRCPGVDRRRGTPDRRGRQADRQGRRRLALGSTPPPTRLNPFKLVTGEWPRGDGEIAIDKSTAEKQGFEVGQMVGASPTARWRSTGSQASSASAPSTRSAARRSRSSTSRPGVVCSTRSVSST